MMRKNRTGIEPKATEPAPRALSPVSEPFAWVREMDAWFDDIRREFDRAWAGVPSRWAPSLLSDGTRAPAVDVRDNGGEFVVTAEMPGVAKEDLQIQATPDALELRAEARTEREDRDDDHVYRECSYSGYRRTVALPAEVVPDKAAATLENGVLEVRVPKAQPTPAPKAVQVKVQ